MNFQHWLRQTFSRRPARRGQPARPRCLPRAELLEDRLSPAVLTVNSELDNTTAGNGLVTFREAITASLTRGTIDSGVRATGDDIIRFAPGLDGKAVTLTTFTESGVAGRSAFLIRNTKLVIDGETGLTRGVTIARDQTKTPFRLFYIDNFQGVADVTLQGVTVSGFTVQGGAGGGGDAAGGGGGAGMGGAIFNRGKLTLINSTLTGNTAVGGGGGSRSINKDAQGGNGGGGTIGDGGASSNANGGNGGFPNAGAGGTFKNNSGQAGSFGGGGGGGYGAADIISNIGQGGAGGFGGGGGGGGSDEDGTITVTVRGGVGGGSLFGGGGGGGGASSQYVVVGGAGGFGGGTGGSAGFGLRPNESRIDAGNSGGGGGGGGAGMGGAIFNAAGTVVITNSTLAGNTARGGAGGGSLFRDAGRPGQGLGGGLFNHNGTVTITNATIAGNAADGGRGVYNRGDSVVIPGSTSTTATAAVTNTIIDDFVGTQSGGLNATRGTHNLIQTASGFGGSFGTADPKLGPLQNNGGRTPTLAVGTDSPAFNAGTSTGAPTRDQRGQNRFGRPEIGAVEVAAWNAVVNTSADAVAANDRLSLREAIDFLNGGRTFDSFTVAERVQIRTVESAAGLITFAPELNGSTLTLSAVGDTRFGPSAFSVSSSFAVRGPDGDRGIMLDAGGAMRHFAVTGSGKLTLQNLTLRGGVARGANGRTGGGDDGLGGAVYNQGALTILGSTLTANSAQGGSGGSLLGFGADGGDGRGGAIYNGAGVVTVTNSTFFGNTATAGARGTGFIDDGDPGLGQGGGLFNRNGTVTVVGSTFSGNTAFQGGRGIYTLATPLARASVGIHNTIIGQGDLAGVDFTGRADALGTSTTSGSGNLIRTQSGFAGSVASTADPRLGPLQSNGGPTPTLALLAGSPAVNAGLSSDLVPSADQRGTNRVGAPDIGAFEVGPVSQQITFSQLSPRTYGNAPFRIDATASSGLPVTFTASGKAEVYQQNGQWFVRLLGAGEATITANQAGNGQYAAAAGVARTFSIGVGALVIEADSANRLYGAENPPLTGRVSGLAAGDTLASVTRGTLTFTTDATPASFVGLYRITGGGLTVASDNYVLVTGGNVAVLEVRAVTTANLRAVLASQSAVTLRVQPGEIDRVVAAINALPAQSSRKTITLNLTSGTYSGVTVRPPAGVTLVISGSGGAVTFVGASPAFTVAGGDVRVEYVTLTNDTPSPTILVTGGKLTLRHDEIWETPRFNDPAIVVLGGSLDMGTPNDPGDNGMHGHGNFLWAADPGAVTMWGDRFDVDGLMTAGWQPTTTTVTTRAATTALGQGVRITARVVPWDGGTPTGNVHFFDVATKTDLGRVPLTVVGGVAQAAFTTFLLPIGSHEIRATYEGDGTYIPSEAVVDQTVIPPVRAAGSEPGAAPVVTITDGGAAAFQIAAFDPAFTGGVNAAVISLDGRFQIVAGAGPGGGPLVRVFDVASGGLVREFVAFDPAFRGGVTVAAGTLGDAGVYVVAAGPGGGPHVQVYDARDGSLLSSFFAYDVDFAGGVNVSVGDVNGDGRLDVVTGAGPGGSPHVKVFDAATGQLLRSFFAFDPGFMGGVSVAVGDADGDGRDDIAAGAGPGSGPAVAVFDGPSGAPLSTFTAYDDETIAGVLVAWTGLEIDGAGVLKVGKGPDGTDPHVFNALTGETVDPLFEDVLLEGSGLFAGSVA